MIDREVGIRVRWVDGVLGGGGHTGNGKGGGNRGAELAATQVEILVVGRAPAGPPANGKQQ